MNEAVGGRNTMLPKNELENAQALSANLNMVVMQIGSKVPQTIPLYNEEPFT